MIKAELIHNPYLLTTEVKFNNQGPKINCQIEKYEHKPLKDWVKKVPGIFYDEMNGYDFDFYFTGTAPDFAEIIAAFKSEGVKPEQVRLFHKNEIEDSETKSAEIDALLEWLRQHPNRKFDFDEFWQRNEELFEGAYPYIVIGGDIPDEIGIPISAESISRAEELAQIDLSGTPIIFFIEERKRRQFRSNLNMLLRRKDVRQEQLFFIIDPAMNTEQVTRVISDLGVINPQVVERYDADEILSYIRNYPVTGYVRDAIKLFEDVVKQINEVLEVENRESEVTNAGIHEQIDGLEKELAKLKEADEFFVQRDNYVMPYQFSTARQELEDTLARWKNRKTKIVGEYEALTAASDYSDYIGRAMTAFYTSVENAYLSAGKTISEDFSVVYANAGVDTAYMPEGIMLGIPQGIVIPDLKTEFYKLKEITYEEARNDFFGLFKKAPDENSEPVQVVTSYLDQWRSRAAEIVLPAVGQLIDRYFAELLRYYDDMAEDYHKHLVKLIGEKTGEKETVSSHLSDDEKRLQEDNDWLSEVKDQLQNIERG